MRAIVFTKHGPIEEEGVIQLKSDWSKPEIKHPRDVLVKVEAASINPVDWKVAEGYLKLLAPVKSFPNVMGMDYAGRIEALGTDFSKESKNPDLRLAVGDRVHGKISMPTGAGAQAEYVVLRATVDSIIHTPEYLSMEKASTLGIVSTTAWEALVPMGRLDPANLEINASKKVLVFGCSGGVGLATCQILRALKVGHITGVCSSRNSEFMLSNKLVDRVIEYDKPGKYATDPATSVLGDHFGPEDAEFYDLCVDCVGGDDKWKLCNDKPKCLVKTGGIFVGIVGGKGNDTPSVGDLLKTGWNIVSRKVTYQLGVLNRINFQFQLGMLSHKALVQLTEFYEKHRIEPFVFEDTNVFALEDFAKAYALSKSAKARGKLIFKISE